jgi:hypothetical protein
MRPRDFSHYNIYRSAFPDGPWDLLFQSTLHIFFDQNPLPESNYYRITSVDLYGNESEPSEIAAPSLTEDFAILSMYLLGAIERHNRRRPRYR